MKHLKELIVQKVHECFDKARARWPGETFKFPNIRFDKRGNVAGTANGGKWELNFNMVLCAENVEDFIAQVVPHEVAHLLDHQVYDMNAPRYDRFGKRKRRQPHGANWARCMAVLGVPAKRCHNYDTSNAKVRKTTVYKYKCTKCEHVLEMGAKRHNKQQNGKANYWHVGCNKAPIVYVGKS